MNINETTESSLTSTIHVRLKDIENEEIFHFRNCEVEFDASSTRDINEGTAYFWDFGDGEYGEGINVSHIYAHRGTYTATLYAKGWDHSISKTFDVHKGSEDPKQVYIAYSFTKPTKGYLICNINERMVFDIIDIIGSVNLYYVEWDFNADGIYEENVTSSWIIKSFNEPGYFEISFRYTYCYKSSPYVWFDQKSPLKDEGNYDQSVISYFSTSSYVKAIVRNKDNTFPLIPDFITEAPGEYSWWNQHGILKDYHSITEQKNVTYLKYYSSWNLRLNSWANPVTLNANSTILPKGASHKDFFYFWDFGDGETATGIRVSHEFENPQSDYLVKLTVWNDSFNVSIIKIVAPRPTSPNIYLYRENSGYDTIRIIVDGRVTKTVPMVELGKEIIWKNVFIENGKLYYNEQCYDFLYYEEQLDRPQTSKYGWILERNEKGDLFLDGKLMSLEDLKNFFRIELSKAGLFENEIEDFVDEWLGKGSRLFPGESPFRYAIMYIPENMIEEIIQIETERTYDEIIRVHFLIQPINGDITLYPPEYPKHLNGRNILHEWGVYFVNSVSGEDKDDNQNSFYDNFIDSNHELQMSISYENRIKIIF
jgi:PKD repeat protein